jgi:hypothetical protein
VREITRTLSDHLLGTDFGSRVGSVSACQVPRAVNKFWLKILAQMPPKVNGVDLLGITQRGEKGGIQCVNIFHPMGALRSRNASTGIRTTFSARRWLTRSVKACGENSVPPTCLLLRPQSCLSRLLFALAAGERRRGAVRQLVSG